MGAERRCSQKYLLMEVFLKLKGETVEMCLFGLQMTALLICIG